MDYKIKELRKKQKLSQAELSALSGVSRATISGLESGRKDVVKSNTLINLAQALGVSVQQIFLD